MIPAGRVKAFAYLIAEKASLYRAIMRVFIESKERFDFYLRPSQILGAVRTCGIHETPDQEELESALAQLCEWGNLEPHPDADAVHTVEDFYKPHYVYQLTHQGEAAEQALDAFQASSSQTAELRTSALGDIVDLLHELKQLSTETQPDSRKIHRHVTMLRVRFEDFASQAETFMASLQKKVYLQAAKSGQLGSHTKHLADYVERFVREFLMFGDAIAKADQEIEPSAVEKLLRIAAERSIADSASATSEDFERVLTELRAQWEGFRSWFISRPGSPSRAEILRGQARASITRLLSLTTSINDTQIGQIDRTNDFRILARWFAEAESDGAAHLLWRSAFGLSPARHLMINELTLDDQEAQDAGADASWLDAPPMRISQRLRSSGSYSRSGRLSRIVDRTAEKEKLADTLQQEAMRILSAQSRFASCGRLRLSDLDQLEGCEFDLFLDLLGEAISASAFAPGAADILSNDSGLCVRLEPAGDGRVAVIHTPEGTFSGPDFWISVEPVSAEEVFR